MRGHLIICAAYIFDTAFYLVPNMIPDEKVIQELSAGRGFIIGNLFYQPEADGSIEIQGYSVFISTASMPKGMIDTELNEIEDAFLRFINQSEALQTFFNSRQIIFALYVDLKTTSVLLAKRSM